MGSVRSVRGGVRTLATIVLPDVDDVSPGVHRIFLASAVGFTAACERGPILEKTPTPPPRELCRTFIEMVQRERPADAPVLSRASLDAKFEQCAAYNEAIFRKSKSNYESIADCAKHQDLPVNWSVCGFRIE